MKRLFIRVPGVSSCHIIPIDEIKCICSCEIKEEGHESLIILKDFDSVIYSTATLDEIYMMINFKQK